MIERPLHTRGADASQRLPLGFALASFGGVGRQRDQIPRCLGPIGDLVEQRPDPETVVGGRADVVEFGHVLRLRKLEESTETFEFGLGVVEHRVELEHRPALGRQRIEVVDQQSHGHLPLGDNDLRQLAPAQRSPLRGERKRPGWAGPIWQAGMADPSARLPGRKGTWQGLTRLAMDIDEARTRQDLGQEGHGEGEPWGGEDRAHRLGSLLVAAAAISGQSRGKGAADILGDLGKDVAAGEAVAVPAAVGGVESRQLAQHRALVDQLSRRGRCGKGGQQRGAAGPRWGDDDDRRRG